MALSGILKLPNELLIDLFESFKYSKTIPSLRLTCRHFNELSSHLLLRAAYLDISRPETLTRLQDIADHPNISKGVRELYIRLHFFHPWVAASFENFVGSVKSEWTQRTSLDSFVNHGGGTTRIDFEEIARRFLSQLRITQVEDDSQNGENAAATDHPTILRVWGTLSRAYDIYKRAFQAQDHIVSSGKLMTAISQIPAKFINLSTITIYDRELHNNHDPGAGIMIDHDDYTGQEEALIRVFSRTMVWEDARWIRPSQEIWDGVPVALLVDIPLAVGNTGSVYIDFINIEVSAAPDYTPLLTNPKKLATLSAAIESMSLYQLRFSPRCGSGCGPWVEDDEVPRERSPADIKAIDRYIGALINSKTISVVDISLDEFWYSAGYSSFPVPSMGGFGDWFLTSGPELSMVTLGRVQLTTAQLKRLATALCEGAELRLTGVYLVDGSWREIKQILQDTAKDLMVYVSDPFGGRVETDEAL